MSRRQLWKLPSGGDICWIGDVHLSDPFWILWTYTEEEILPGFTSLIKVKNLILALTIRKWSLHWKMATYAFAPCIAISTKNKNKDNGNIVLLAPPCLWWRRKCFGNTSINLWGCSNTNTTITPSNNDRISWRLSSPIQWSGSRGNCKTSVQFGSNATINPWGRGNINNLPVQFSV